MGTRASRDRRCGVAHHRSPPDGTPQSSPISFLWDGATIFFYSQPGHAQAPQPRPVAARLVPRSASDDYADHAPHHRSRCGHRSLHRAVRRPSRLSAPSTRHRSHIGDMDEAQTARGLLRAQSGSRRHGSASSRRRRGMCRLEREALEQVADVRSVVARRRRRAGRGRRAQLPGSRRRPASPCRTVVDRRQRRQAEHPLDELQDRRQVVHAPARCGRASPTAR